MANSWPPRVENIEPVSGSARKIEEEGEEKKEKTELEIGSSQTRGRVKRLEIGSSPDQRRVKRLGTGSSPALEPCKGVVFIPRFTMGG